MMKYILCIILFVGICANLSSQTTDLDSLALDAARFEAEIKYKLFFESVLNIIDNDLPIEDRYRSRSVLVELFENSNCNIFDIIDTRIQQSYKPHTYSFKLLDAEQNLPIYHKKFKFSNNFKFDTLAFRGMNREGEPSFGIYEADLFILEKLTNSAHIEKSLVNAPSFNAYESGLVKKVTFNLMHDKDGIYRLSINSISIHAKNERDYSDIRKQIEKNEYSWSDKSEEQYLKKLKQEAEKKGIELVPLIPEFETIIIDSILVKQMMIKDSTLYQPASFRDYVIPGIGHMKYGRGKTQRTFTSVTYGGIFVASAGYSIYSKIKSNQFYNNHIDAETFRLSDYNLSEANKHNKRFLISGGIAVLTWVSNAVHLRINDGKQRKLILQGKGSDRLELGYDINFSSEQGAGLSLNLAF